MEREASANLNHNATTTRILLPILRPERDALDAAARMD
jgi:hypothetical protein